MKSSFNWPGRPPAEMISRNVKRLLTSILDGTLKRGAFCTSTLDGTLKRGAFYTSILDGRLKRDAFLCTRVGAYCIRPTFLTIKINGTQIRSTKRPCKGTGSTKGDQTHDFLSPTGPFDGAYAIRPYHATSKRDAFYTSYLVATPKRGAFCTSYLVATLKRGAFCTSYLVGALKGGAFCLFYSSFLALMQEKKQKKIKASAEAGEVGRVHDRWSRGRGQVCLLFFRLLFLAYSFSYVSVLYFRSEGVHSDVS